MDERVRLEPLNRRLRVQLDGSTIVDTTSAITVHENGLPPRYYVPKAEVHAELVHGERIGTCPWKGKWRHVAVTAAGKRVDDGGWTYFETTAVCANVQDYVAFYPEKMDGFVID